MKMDWRLIKRSFTSSLDEVDRRFWRLGWENRKGIGTALRGDETFRGKAGEFPVKRGGEEGNLNGRFRFKN